jgi:hypothetical protein
MESSNLSYQDQFSNMELRLTEMEEKIDTIDTKLTQVVDAILGNPLTKTGGFLNDIEVMKSQIHELQTKQIKYEDFRKKIVWTIGIIVAVGAIVQFASTIYMNVKKA